jgi:hypothetical protein
MLQRLNNTKFDGTFRAKTFRWNVSGLVNETFFNFNVVILFNYLHCYSLRFPIPSYMLLIDK